MALLVVAIMVVSAFILMAPAAAPASAPVALAPAGDVADAQAGVLARQVTYTVSNIGESYVKDFRPLRLGVIPLKKGRGLLTLRATDIPGRQVMDVRELRLTRIE